MVTMLSLFSRPRTCRPEPCFRPRLESLEGRTCPADLNVNVCYGAGLLVHLSGQLTDAPDVADQTIDFSGQVNGTAVTDADGDFSVDLTASGAGLVFAVHEPTESMNTFVLDGGSIPPPAISRFACVEHPLQIWTFEGHVDYSFADQMTIYFSGGP